MTFIDERQRMVEVQLKGRGIKDELVLQAMGKVPRQKFITLENRDLSYRDGPFPIGCGQTISQPYMVAIMTEALNLKGGEKLLEVGTGSGYQAAVLAEIANQIYTVERHSKLASSAKTLLEELGYDNVHVSLGDGTLGLEDYAPFDGIIVTAGAPTVPHSLQSQLKEGGRLVIPVGGHTMQTLMRITKRGKLFDKEYLLGCVFVPLVGKEGWDQNVK